MNYKIMDLPKFFSIDVYEEYIKEYIRKVKHIEGVISIYQMGSISSPGISDIDLIIVVEENFNVSGYQNLSINSVFKEDEIAKYLFIHDVMVIDKKSFKDIQYINYCTNLKLLYGENIEPISLEEEEGKVVKFSIISDFIISRLHQFEKFEKNNIFLVRGNIVRASSLKHSISLAKSIGMDFNSDEILKCIQNIRNTWFENQDIDDVKECFNKTIKCFYELIIKSAEYFEKEFLIFNELNYKDYHMILSDNTNLTIFTDKENVKKYYREEIRSNIYRGLEYINKNSTVIFYPRELYFHYLTYSKTINNNLSQQISKKLINTDIIFEVSKKYKETMQKRAEVISTYNKFLLDNKLYFSNGIGYPGFNMLSK